jgi:hypothetical protein
MVDSNKREMEIEGERDRENVIRKETKNQWEKEKERRERDNEKGGKSEMKFFNQNG